MIFFKMYRQKYRHNIRLVLIVCYFVSLFFLLGCQTNVQKNIDTSKVDIHFKTIHYHRDVYAMDTSDLEASVELLTEEHPLFSSVFFNELTGFNANNNKDTFLASIRHFLTYKDYKNLYDTVQKKFPNTKKIDRQLENLFKHIKYYYPEENWGTVYYFISGLNQWSAVTVDTLLGIGLDMHLGKDFPFYPSVGLPLYQIEVCEPEYIAVNASKTIFENKFPLNPEGKTLLDLMLLKGLQMTFLEYTLPELSDEMLMGYSKQQLKWCQENERMIWSYFKKQNLLFSTQWQQIMRYVNEGPSSTGMPQESPGNIGTWMGWQIVRKYLDNHPSIKWNDLTLRKLNGQQFLSEAKYKP